MSNTPNHRLGTAIDAARGNVDIDAVWNLDRELRVREGTVRRHDLRVRRHRVLRRGAVIASGAGLLVLALLARVEGASSVATAPAETTTGTAMTAAAPAPTSLTSPTALALAATSLNDAGYAHD